MGMNDEKNLPEDGKQRLVEYGKNTAVSIAYSIKDVSSLISLEYKKN